MSHKKDPKKSPGSNRKKPKKAKDFRYILPNVGQIVWAQHHGLMWPATYQGPVSSKEADDDDWEGKDERKVKVKWFDEKTGLVAVHHVQPFTDNDKDQEYRHQTASKEKKRRKSTSFGQHKRPPSLSVRQELKRHIQLASKALETWKALPRGGGILELQHTYHLRPGDRIMFYDRGRGIYGAPEALTFANVTQIREPEEIVFSEQLHISPILTDANHMPLSLGDDFVTVVEAESSLKSKDEYKTLSKKMLLQYFVFVPGTVSGASRYATELADSFAESLKVGDRQIEDNLGIVSNVTKARELAKSKKVSMPMVTKLAGARPPSSDDSSTSDEEIQSQSAIKKVTSDDESSVNDKRPSTLTSLRPTSTKEALSVRKGDPQPSDLELLSFVPDVMSRPSNELLPDMNELASPDVFSSAVTRTPSRLKLLSSRTAVPEPKPESSETTQPNEKTTPKRSISAMTSHATRKRKSYDDTDAEGSDKPRLTVDDIAILHPVCDPPESPELVPCTPRLCEIPDLGEPSVPPIQFRVSSTRVEFPEPSENKTESSTTRKRPLSDSDDDDCLSPEDWWRSQSPTKSEPASSLSSKKPPFALTPNTSPSSPRTLRTSRSIDKKPSAAKKTKIAPEKDLSRFQSKRKSSKPTSDEEAFAEPKLTRSKTRSSAKKPEKQRPP